MCVETMMKKEIHAFIFPTLYSYNCKFSQISKDLMLLLLISLFERETIVLLFFFFFLFFFFLFFFFIYAFQ